MSPAVTVTINHSLAAEPDRRTALSSNRLPYSALSLRKADAGSAAIFGNELHAGILESGYESLSGFGATTNVSLGGLQSLDRRSGYPGVFGQVILRPAEQSSGRLDLAN
jgi:hypothetical protein